MINYQPTLSAKECFNYINEMHLDGHEQAEFQDPEWVYEIGTYHLTWINLSDERLKLCKGCHGTLGYEALDTPLPPIVIGNNGFIIDGMHRYSAALAGGKTIILAYVPEWLVESQ
ncbi:hypothetical protein VCHA53O466_320021 [Vibrio chagasii]|nr:hypothetical protein VCHA53O466_320021 [Vibrio chagasii]